MYDAHTRAFHHRDNSRPLGSGAWSDVGSVTQPAPLVSDVMGNRRLVIPVSKRDDISAAIAIAWLAIDGKLADKAQIYLPDRDRTVLEIA